jgi:hypothetical protein
LKVSTGSWKKAKRRTTQSNSSGDADKELQAALEASELEAAISMSLQKDNQGNQIINYVNLEN